MTNLYGLFTWSKLQNLLQNVQLQKFCRFFCNNFLQNFCKSIWDQDKRYSFLGYFQKRLLNDRFMTSSSFLFLKKFFHIFCKKFAKKLQKSCKKIAKKLQKSCKMRKRNFLLCKIFAKFLQILNLHTDFRPREESVRAADVENIFCQQFVSSSKQSRPMKYKQCDFSIPLSHCLL